MRAFIFKKCSCLRESIIQLLLMGAFGGLAGSLFDSLLGAAVQLLYWDDVKQKDTEKRFKYGRELQRLRGWPWMTNDAVNLIASLVGGGVAVLFS